MYITTTGTRAWRGRPQSLCGSLNEGRLLMNQRTDWKRERIKPPRLGHRAVTLLQLRDKGRRNGSKTDVVKDGRCR